MLWVNDWFCSFFGNWVMWIGDSLAFKCTYNAYDWRSWLYSTRLISPPQLRVSHPANCGSVFGSFCVLLVPLRTFSVIDLKPHSFKYIFTHWETTLQHIIITCSHSLCISFRTCCRNRHTSALSYSFLRELVLPRPVSFTGYRSHSKGASIMPWSRVSLIWCEFHTMGHISLTGRESHISEN